MRQVQVYIEGNKLDLFQDEQINVTSKQQDINDISKTFTDFSQSFSVPSTPNNDNIFSYFYNSDFGDITQPSTWFDPNLRRSGFIEIDYTTFRTGTIQLEKAEVKNNKAYSYQITFYGDILALKDKFKEDKISDLSYLNVNNFDYSASEIQDRITDGSTTYNIRFPLIFDRDITYGTGGSTDISPTGSGAVAYNELFPAIRVVAIFSAIQIKYGITFNTTLFSDERFTNAYLYCQNTEEFQFYTSTELLNYDYTVAAPSNANTSLLASDYFNLTNNTLNYQYIELSTAFPDADDIIYLAYFEHRVHVFVFGLSNTSIQYYIDILTDGQITQTLEYSGEQFLYNVIVDNNVTTLNKQLQFQVRADEALTLSIRIVYEQKSAFIPQGQGSTVTRSNQFYANHNDIALTNQFNVLNYLPDITVNDFFKGILNMFNLTCYGTEEDVYQLESIDDWYAKGAIVDITEYTDINSVKIDRVKLFKTIEFNYQQSESGTNTIFRNLTGREYGNAKQQFDYDGGEFKIELPFENMQMQRFQGTNLQIGETIKTDGNKYVPKPMILYQYDQLSADYRFDNGTSTSTLTEYVPFGQDVVVNGENYTLNFNAEISTLTNQVEQNTLFKIYYSGYLLNLYNLKNRKINVKTQLPISLLTGLRLNDRVIIRDKRYIIDTMKSNLTSGQVDFVLINDFRPVLADTQVPQEKPIPIPGTADCANIKIILPNNCIQADITSSDPGVTITPSTLTSDGFVEVCFPANTDSQVLKTEDDADYVNTEDLAYRIKTEENALNVITLDVEYTFQNGLVQTTQIYLNQNP